MVKAFRYPKSLRVWSVLISVLGVSALLFITARRGFDLDSLVAMLLTLALAVVLSLGVHAEKITLDDQKITYKDLTGSKSLMWSEIDDVYYSPYLIFIASTQRKKRIELFGGGYGFSQESIAAVQKEVTDRTSTRLIQVWEQLRLPITYSYPGLPPSTILGYMLVISLILFFFVYPLLDEPQLLLANWRFLLPVLISILVLAPFLIRDYRFYHKNLILAHDGLRLMNGKAIFIPWHAIREIFIKSPLWYTPLVVRSNDGKTMKIPSRLPNYGQILYLIKKRTGIEETYGPVGGWV